MLWGRSAGGARQREGDDADAAEQKTRKKKRRNLGNPPTRHEKNNVSPVSTIVLPFYRRMNKDAKNAVEKGANKCI